MRVFLLFFICLTTLSFAKIPPTPKGYHFSWNLTNVSHVRPQCLIDASRKFQIPLAVILTIMDVEKGMVGMASRNKNGTHDLGPMQINTVHLDILTRKFGVTHNDLQTNGCLNVHVGTWRIASLLKETGGDLWEALGRYHSRTRYHKTKYQGYVSRSYKKLKNDPDAFIRQVLHKANTVFYQK